MFHLQKSKIMPQLGYNTIVSCNSCTDVWNMMIKRHRFIKQKTYIPFFFLFFFGRAHACLLSIFKRIPNAKSVVITIRILKYKRGIEYKSLNYQSMKYTLKFTTWWAANNLLFKGTDNEGTEPDHTSDWLRPATCKDLVIK